MSDFQVTIQLISKPNNFAPVFIQPLIDPLSVSLGQFLVYYLPKTFDGDGNKVSIAINTMNTSDFLQAQISTGMIKMQPTRGS